MRDFQIFISSPGDAAVERRRADTIFGILRWRLGTPLPPAVPDTLPGGEAHPSGTAYEILTSIDKRHRGAELHEVYVFRSTGGLPLIAGSVDP